MEFKDLNEILDFAIEKEQEARQFYLDAASEEHMSGHRQLFHDFAKEEAKHEKLLKDLKTGGVPEGLQDYSWKWIKDIKRSNYVVDLEYRKGMDFRDIFMLAMKREEKALALYNELQREVATDAQKKIFKMLCQEEAKHKLKLETIYDDYMAQLGD
ncbi:MAG: ferritin family protein [Desulfobacterales bacterium]